MKLPAELTKVAVVDPLIVRIYWKELLCTVPAELDLLADMPVAEQLKLHASLLDSLIEGETEVKDDAPLLWADFETRPVYYYVAYKGQATNQVERAKANLCLALATHQFNVMAKEDTFGKGRHIAALKKATQALLLADTLCKPIDDRDHCVPINQACGLSVCTVLWELIFFTTRTLPPLDVDVARLENAAGMLRNIATLTQRIIKAQPAPQKPFMAWAKSTNTWALRTAGFVWAHRLYRKITDRTPCDATAKLLAEAHMLFKFYFDYAKKKVPQFVEDPLDETIVGQFKCGYQTEIRGDWSPVFCRELEQGSTAFLPEISTIVAEHIKVETDFAALFN